MPIRFQLTWFGAQWIFDEPETVVLIAAVNEGRNVAAVIGAAAVVGGAPPVAAVSALVAGIIALGAGALQVCDAARRGIILTVLWIPLPWCTGR